MNKYTNHSSDSAEEQSSDSQMPDKNSDDNNSNMQTKVDKNVLSAILARVTALENENKALKAEEKNKTVLRREIETSKISKSNKKSNIITKKTSKKCPESSLEQSSSEQESEVDNVKVCKEAHQLFYIKNILTFIQWLRNANLATKIMIVCLPCRFQNLLFNLADLPICT